MRYLLLILSLAAVSATAFAEVPIPAELPPAEEAAALRSATQTGAAIYRHDQAASVATDAALKSRRFKRDRRVRGWITEEQGGEINVTFLDEAPAALYRVPVKSGVAGQLVALSTPAALSSYEAGAAAARSAALAAQFEPCAKSYNTVVLPTPDMPEQWLVYLLPGTKKQDIVPIGGTYRFAIKEGQVVSQRGFTLSCIAIESRPQFVALMISHLLDPVPTEAHVFWSMWAKKPIYVATTAGRALWAVDGDTIKRVERESAED